MTPLVIVPARVGSKGVPNKNFALLPDGTTLTERACMMGLAFGEVVLTTDNEGWAVAGCKLHKRPAQWASDTATMRDVVRDVLDAYPGEKDQPILLLQPTTPFRKLGAVQECLNKVMAGACYVTTAYAVPEHFLPDRVIAYRDGVYGSLVCHPAANRQTARQAFVRDGQCYAFRREAILWWDFGFFDDLLVCDPTLTIDSPSDWEEACRRIRQTSA